MERNLQFRSYDGTLLQGTFNEAFPEHDAVALLIHGITSSRDEFGLFSGLAEYIGRRGIPSLRFDYRCHGESRQGIETMTLAGVVNDIEAAARCAVKESGLSAIHAIGMSFGGGLSAYWAANTEQAVKSVVLFAPVIDYEEDVLGQHGLMAENTLTETAQNHLGEHGFVTTDEIPYGRALVNELPYINGIAALKGITCGCLILHGDADSVVPYASSEKFAAVCPGCELVSIAGTDHGFGVEGDEDLSSPETKAKHEEVYELVSRFFLRTGTRQTNGG